MESLENQDVLKQRAQEFYQERRKAGKQAAETDTFPNKTVDELLHQTPLVDSETVDRYLKEGKISGVESGVVEQTWESLHNIRKSINQFTQSKRFFILETIDFFNTPNYIDKVLPALLHLNRDRCKHDVLDFVFSTFSTLNRNIETIISIPGLFSQASLHMERGGLYTLSSDIAKSIEKLFSESYYTGFKSKTSDVARVIEIFSSYQCKADERSALAAIPQIQHLVKPESILRQTVLDFISQIQTHNLLLLYSFKRHAFYKQFLKQILKKTKLNLFQPDVSSIILAGCLTSNPQLFPPKKLLDDMISEQLYDAPDTRRIYSEFVDQLSPSTVYDIIGDYKNSIVKIASVEQLSVINQAEKRKAISIYSKIKKKILKSDGEKH